MQLAPTEAEKLAQSFVHTFKDTKNEVVVCPDFLSLAAVSKIFKSSDLSLGAQDASAFERGAYTGEVSAFDLSSLGVKYVIIGHSERRTCMEESDKLISGKIKAVSAEKLIPVLCVGENATERKQGKAASVIRGQLKGAFKSLPAKNLRSVVIAYEPIWAIGTGVNCDPLIATRMKTIIKDWCERAGLKKTAILYGGSVKTDNATSFLGKAGYDGLLIGGASLYVDSFKNIVNAKSK